MTAITLARPQRDCILPSNNNPIPTRTNPYDFQPTCLAKIITQCHMFQFYVPEVLLGAVCSLHRIFPAPRLLRRKPVRDTVAYLHVQQQPPTMQEPGEADREGEDTYTLLLRRRLAMAIARASQRSGGGGGA
ncbi:MAG: hypothetical protein Q9184_006456 [Pyrenodesmia sp. 2 TL-2023]